MDKVIVAANNKGGVGKTKTTELLCEYFSRFQNKRVLVIDFDPQCNLSQRYLKMDIDPVTPEGHMPPLHPDYDPREDFDWDGRSSIADIFFGKGVTPYPTYIKNLDIAPGHAERLLAAEAVRKSEVLEKVHKQLGNFLQSGDVKAAYDIVIIDTAPSKGPLTTSVIKCATDIIIPAVMEPQSIQGIYGMLQLWMQESLNREPSRPLKLVGILPNMFKSTTALHTDILNSLTEDKSIGKYVIPVQLGNRVAFAEVDSESAAPRSVFDLPKDNAARKEAIAACKYITNRILSS